MLRFALIVRRKSSERLPAAAFSQTSLTTAHSSVRRKKPASSTSFKSISATRLPLCGRISTISDWDSSIRASRTGTLERPSIFDSSFSDNMAPGINVVSVIFCFNILSAYARPVSSFFLGVMFIYIPQL